MDRPFKVLLYTEFENINKISGLGKAVRHQAQALRENNIPYTRNPRDDYDIAHINVWGPVSYFVAKSARRKGKKVVYHAHSTEEDFRNSFIFTNQLAPLVKKWLIKCYKTGDIILTPTPYSKHLLEGYGLKNIHVISNGVDTNFFSPNPEGAKSFRAQYGYKTTDKIIVGIGLYIKRKGILDFIELAKHFPEYQFIWFGTAPRATIPLEINRALATAPKNLKFPGHVPAETIRDALSACNCYVFPTLEETEGIPIIEACSVGAPTLIRDIPVFDPWMVDGVNTHKAKTLDDFIKKLPLIVDKQLPDLSNAARQVAEERDIKKVGLELIKLYRSLLK